MSKQAFEQKLAALDALRATPGDATVASQLRKALKDRNGYYVSKAAALTASLGLASLTPDLLAAFQRFLDNPAKTDPKCWAKIALIKALHQLGHRDPEIYVVGLNYIQLEPVWGGSSDSAGPIRGVCALALVECALAPLEILQHLTDRLADAAPAVRQEAALAIAHFAEPEGILPLRMKALSGDEEPDVIGQCFASLLSLQPEASVAFVARFLSHSDEQVVSEALAALAQSRAPQAFAALQRFWKNDKRAQLRHALLLSLAASPVLESAEFLLSVLRASAGEFALDALSALAASRFRAEFEQRIRAAASEREDDAAFTRAFEKKFPA